MPRTGRDVVFGVARCHQTTRRVSGVRVTSASREDVSVTRDDRAAGTPLRRQSAISSRSRSTGGLLSRRPAQCLQPPCPRLTLSSVGVTSSPHATQMLGQGCIDPGYGAIGTTPARSMTPAATPGSSRRTMRIVGRATRHPAHHGTDRGPERLSSALRNPTMVPRIAPSSPDSVREGRRRRGSRGVEPQRRVPEPVQSSILVS